MKSIQTVLFTGVLSVLLAGCATTQSTSNPSAGIAVQTPSRFVASDRRTIDIGRAYDANNRRSFKNPHLDSCWVAAGFEFKGYDTLYIEPTRSTAKFNQDEHQPWELAKKSLVTELADAIRRHGLFANVATDKSEIKAGAHVLTLENTIVEYAKGGGGARYWAGLYGAGQPILRVQGKALDGDKTLFSYDGRRSGVSASARMFGAMKTDVDIQLEDIRSLTLDLTDFMAAIAGKYTAKK